VGGFRELVEGLDRGFAVIQLPKSNGGIAVKPLRSALISARLTREERRPAKKIAGIAAGCPTAPNTAIASYLISVKRSAEEPS